MFGIAKRSILRFTDFFFGKEKKNNQGNFLRIINSSGMWARIVESSFPFSC
ncbi:hypothetical protein NC99_46460 [Sunxiuqinia dokdonensis]|uniref:Uncharacterized protein n=1 Tax=Sunxiuqinia dokdonensis TaxID=1409788 RepID=A0A0L8V2F0_9BACT|nr:hypothetical protein NC99_46460 [Sunxiuqinia dokdonensis]